MEKIITIIDFLQTLAPLQLQEPYDNAGLITGNPLDVCKGIICALDATEEVVSEAIVADANLIVTHHPLIFKPLKSLSPTSAIKRALLKAIKHDIAIYAIHTNYDNVIDGVNRALALSLKVKKESLAILSPLSGKICKLYFTVPKEFSEQVKNALFAAGAGKIGLYSECSFETNGIGTFRPLEGSRPFIGEASGLRETIEELKLEVIFPIWLKDKVLEALKTSHPYQEVAYEVMMTENMHQETGAGMIAELGAEMWPEQFLDYIKERLSLKSVRHTQWPQKPIKKLAFCGGSGSFLIKQAIASGADAYLTADLKYNDYFEADGKILLVDIGHYESEIAAIGQLTKILMEKFPTFAVLQTKVVTNPVQYR